MSARIRQDVWKLDTWAPTIEWYARGVRDMQSRPFTDPTSWRYQAAIHGYSTGSDPNPPASKPPASEQSTFWSQCQHGSWFFLPWHRMYLFYFEQIVSAAVARLGGPADWALPYWNYSDPANPNAKKVPTAFRQPKMPDGSPNALFVELRDPAANGGQDVSDASGVDLRPALSEGSYTASAHGGDPGFGGPQTGFHHNAGRAGELERVPHNVIHGDVGGDSGLMSSFDTAALDPIFWLHHANIDRLWSVWLNRPGGHKDPSSNGWLTQKFQFHDATEAVVSLTPAQVTDSTAAPLSYDYEDLSDPLSEAVHAATAAGEPGMDQGSIPEMVGATDKPHALAANATTAQLALTAPSGPAAASLPPSASQGRIHLNLENITGTGRAGTYEVYLNVPAGADPQQHRELFVGLMPLFGLEEASRGDAQHAGSGLHYALDATNVIRRLQEANDWDPRSVRVTFVPRRPQGRAAAAAPNVQVGRISLYRS